MAGPGQGRRKRVPSSAEVRSRPVDPGIDSIARRIRRIRLHGRLTMETVADRTGFTKSYISMIESGKKSPPIATLIKIAKALGVDIGAFFEQKNTKDRFFLVKREEREVVVRDGTVFGYQYEAIASTHGRKKMEPFVITLPLESEEKGFFDHEGEELFYVLEGDVRFHYGDKTFLMREGDCIYFDSSVPHRGEGTTEKKSRALVVVSPS